jgi:hypothetical protein
MSVALLKVTLHLPVMSMDCAPERSAVEPAELVAEQPEKSKLAKSGNGSSSGSSRIHSASVVQMEPTSEESTSRVRLWPEELFSMTLR